MKPCACVLSIVTMILVLTASSGFADNREVAFYADEGLSSCELQMSTPGLVKVHMLVTGQGNAGAVQFKAPKPACMNDATWVADVWSTEVLAWVGNTQGAGVDVVFECGPLPRYLGYIWFGVTNPAEACCEYAPQPGGGATVVFPGHLAMVVFKSCEYLEKVREVRANAKGLIVNADDTCRCNSRPDGAPQASQSLLTTTRQTTWGAVKALYR
jgi:hypothetical protein